MNKSVAVVAKAVFIALDFLMLNAAFLLMEWFLNENAVVAYQQQYLLFSIVCNINWLVSAAIYQLYEVRSTTRFEGFMKITAQVYFLFSVLILIYLYFSKQEEISRIFVSGFLVCFAVWIIINRFLYLFASMHYRSKEVLIKRIMIIGYNEIGKRLATFFENDNTHMKLVGYFEDYNKINELSHYPIVSSPHNAIRISQELNINEIYSTILPEQDHRIYDLMQKADEACIRFKLVPDLNLLVNRPMHLNYISGIPVLTQRQEPLEDVVNAVKKRAFDICISVFAIIFVLSWLIPIMAITIWLDSKGPIFFVQKRSGLNNKSFNCLKFRSMKVNGLSETLQASRNDDRMTKLGRFIRKTNIDELPQFFNVLSGDMSVVGPRPHMLKHTKDYSELIPKYMVRQFLKPGITGWAQVNGFRGETTRVEDMQSRVEHDIWYMENWSMWLDVKIIAMTVFNIFKGDDKAF